MCFCSLTKSKPECSSSDIISCSSVKSLKYSIAIRSRATQGSRLGAGLPRTVISWTLWTLPSRTCEGKQANAETNALMSLLLREPESNLRRIDVHIRISRQVCAPNKSKIFFFFCQHETHQKHHFLISEIQIQMTGFVIWKTQRGI